MIGGILFTTSHVKATLKLFELSNLLLNVSCRFAATSTAGAEVVRVTEEVVEEVVRLVVQLS